MNSLAEENYLKAIYKLLEKGDKKVNTNAIASLVETAPASVTDMLKRLSSKKLIQYEKYQGVSLTSAGKKTAISVIRKHRLWELFLVEKLSFQWDEVHELAEQLEHIQSPLLIERLDQFLSFPKFDPHGDPIPDKQGNFEARHSLLLSEMKPASQVIITGVVDHTPVFLRHIARLGLSLGEELKISERFDYDNSMHIRIKSARNITHLSYEVAKNILVMLKN